jgi:hypothetical protein
MAVAVSHSRAEGYLTCRRKDYYGYTLELQRVSESIAFSHGSAVHSMLEVFYRTMLEAGDTPAQQIDAWDNAVLNVEKHFAEMKAEGYEDPDKRAPLALIFEKYLENEPYVRNGWTILAVEAEFNLAIEDDLEYPFVVDLIVQDDRGAMVVVDHKSAYDFFNEEDARLMPQIPKYIGALRALGYKVAYGQYNLLRTRPDTKVGRPLNEWHRNFDVKPTAQRVKTTFTEQVGVAREIAMRSFLPVEQIEETAYRVANKMICGYCQFADLCSEELRGGNVKLMLSTEYKQKEKRDKIAVTEVED